MCFSIQIMVRISNFTKANDSRIAYINQAKIKVGYKSIDDNAKRRIFHGCLRIQNNH